MNQPLSPSAAAVGEVASIARRLAGFAHNLDPSAVPDAVWQRAKLHILDACGIALASTTYDFARAAAAGIEALAGAGGFPVIGMGLRLPLRDSVHLNGILVHGLDFDDTHAGAVTHVTASLWPTVLAVGLQQGADGREALAAYLAGVECAARIGAAARGGFHVKGFHPTGVVGTFACAIAAGRLVDLSPDRLAQAQGIALSMAAGSLEFLADGAGTKRLHPGWAGACGITAATLARHGTTGPGAPYEGRFGLYASYMADGAKVDPAGIGATLGREWELEKVAFKPFPACHLAHACIDAALALRRAHRFALDDIEAIVARVGAGPVPVICEPQADKRRPRSAYEAQFSLHYMIAAALRRGRFTLAELDADALNDPAIQALAAKVSYEIDPDSAYPRYYDGAVEIRLADGRTLTHTEAVNRGSDANPLSPGDVAEKFRGNAARAVGRRRSDRIHDAIMALDTAPGLDELADALSLA